MNDPDMPRGSRRLPSAEVVIEIPFHDVDMMGVAWHGHYVKYYEIARCALLDTISYNYREMEASGYAWPVIDMHLRYARPARMGQKIQVRASLREYELQLKIDYLISDNETGERLSRGQTTQVPVDIATGEMRFGAPPVLIEKLKQVQ
jgi:acyl-CoA thioester hydrolase